MKTAWFAAPMTLLIAGCAAPLPERHWDDRLEPADRSRTLPRSIATDHPVDRGSREARIEPLEHDEISTIEDMIEWSLAHHPRLHGSRARWQAARERIPQAQALPDPTLSYRIDVEQADRNRTPIGHIFAVSQRFPWFGNLEIAGEIESAEARAAAASFVYQQFDMVAQIKAAWAEFVFLHAAADIRREQIDLLRRLEGAVRARYRAADVRQADLLRVQAELDRAETDLADTEDFIEAIAARLNTASGRPPGSDLPMPSPLPDPGDPPDADRLLELLIRANPELARRRHEIAAGRHAVRLARRRGYPDFTLGIEYGLNTSRRMAGMDGGGEDMVAGMISVSIPLWRESYESGVREALAGWAGAVREIDDATHRLQADVRGAVYVIRDAQRRETLFRDRLTARARQVLGNTEAAYRAGDATFTDLIDAQRELLEFSLAAERARADRFAGLARLEAMLGHALDDRAGPAPEPDRTEGHR